MLRTFTVKDQNLCLGIIDSMAANEFIVGEHAESDDGGRRRNSDGSASDLMLWGSHLVQ